MTNNRIVRMLKQHRGKKHPGVCNSPGKCSLGLFASMIMNNMLNLYFKSLYMTIINLGQMIRKPWLIILQHFPGKNFLKIMF